MDFHQKKKIKKQATTLTTRARQRKSHDQQAHLLFTRTAQARASKTQRDANVREKSPNRLKTMTAIKRLFWLHLAAWLLYSQRPLGQQP